MQSIHHLQPFTQTVGERNGYDISTTAEAWGQLASCCLFFIQARDPVAAGLPHCLKAVAAMAVAASRGLVGYMPLTLLVPHKVSSILLTQKTSHLTASRFLSYHHVLLSMPNIVLQRCTVLNPATLLPTPEDGEPHDCVAIIN